jgi:hypothetical protein
MAAPTRPDTRRGPLPAQAVGKRKGLYMERIVLVRLIPRTGIFGRVRAVVALSVIAVALGLAAAGALGLIVWGLATAIHHAANN